MNMDAEIYDDELGTKFHKDAIPADMEKAEEYHQAMVEAICETDEALLEKFLSDEEISVDELKAALRKLLSIMKSFLCFAEQLTETRVFKCFLTQLSSTCLHR